MFFNFLKNRVFYSCGMAVGLAFAVSATPVVAATYVLPEGDVIGRIQTTNAKAKDSLYTIARRFDVGIDALVRANPGVDIKKPGAGTKILLPTRHVLPPGPREGVVINLAEKRLYHYMKPPKGPPLVSTFPIALGASAGRLTTGDYMVDRRVHKPSWTVPKKLIAETQLKKRERLPDVMPPGKGNVLGEYAMYLKDSDHIIHSSTQPWRVGQAGGVGYISLYPEDMNILVHRTTVDTPVRVINKPFKVGYQRGLMNFEVHKPKGASNHVDMRVLVNRLTHQFGREFWSEDWQRIRTVVGEGLGVAMPVAHGGKKGKSVKRWMLHVSTFKSEARAREIVLRVDRLGIPVAMRACEADGCKVMVGPFSDRQYMNEVAKRIRWITRIRAKVVPYRNDDLTLDRVLQMAAAPSQSRLQ